MCIVHNGPEVHYPVLDLSIQFQEVELRPTLIKMKAHNLHTAIVSASVSLHELTFDYDLMLQYPPKMDPLSWENGRKMTRK